MWIVCSSQYVSQTDLEDGTALLSAMGDDRGFGDDFNPRGIGRGIDDDDDEVETYQISSGMSFSHILGTIESTDAQAFER